MTTTPTQPTGGRIGKPPRTPPPSWSLTRADNEGIPEFILWKQLRQELGLTVRDLAALVGVSRNLVHKWEQGASYPNADAHPKLLAVLDKAR